MNEGFPPLVLRPPESRKRRADSGRNIPLPPEILAKRAEIAAILKVKITGLSKRLKSLSDAERKAVFYKLEHEKPLAPTSLSGIDLKVIAQPTPEVIYAVPKQSTFNKLLKKLDDFATGPVKNKHVPNEWLAQLKYIEEADPKDRLSGELRDNYASLVDAPSMICEIEFLSLERGVNKQKKEIEGWIAELQDEFAGGTKGNFFEHETMLPTCRAVIRCTGSMFARLVTASRWIERIRWIESRPRFQTFREVLDAFRMQDLSPISSPARDAAIVCIVDSGVTSGNPFLEKVVRPELAKSFLKKQPTNPHDEHEMARHR